MRFFFILRRLAIGGLALLAAACAGGADLASPGMSVGRSRPPVILVSIDGLRPVALGRGDTPHLDALARRGVRARWMQPSFPTLTFPNHYTLVTGLRPDVHGVVGNTMEDPAIPGVRFRLENREATSDPRWWDQAEPIWVTAEARGVRTATLFWPGSEVAIRGIRPGQWKPFDRDLPNEDRVDIVLQWLSAPVETRPGFVTLYFNDVDHLGHEAGPDSPDARAALRDVDAAVGRLVAGLAAQGLAANIVVVSDHGMATVSPGQQIALDEQAPPALYRVVYSGAVVGLEPRDGQDEALAARLVGRHAHLRCWRRENLPRRLHFGRNPRVPSILCLADVGWSISSTRGDGFTSRAFGAHGYDNAAPEMRAVFIAAGPDFARGQVLPPMDNTRVHPMLMRLLGFQPRSE